MSIQTHTTHANLQNTLAHISAYTVSVFSILKGINLWAEGSKIQANRSSEQDNGKELQNKGRFLIASGATIIAAVELIGLLNVYKNKRNNAKP